MRAIAGVAAGPLSLATLGQSVNLGYEGGHETGTVLGWAALGIGFAVVAFLYWRSVYRHKRGDTNVNYGRQDVGINKGSYCKGGSDE